MEKTYRQPKNNKLGEIIQMRSNRVLARLGLVCWILFGSLLPPGVQAAITSGPNNTVNAIAQGADGTTYFGGNFTYWGPNTGHGAALEASTAAVNLNFPVVNGAIYVVAADGAGC